MYSAGFGKHEITAFVPGIGMMGYGQLHNVVAEVATPLWARSLILRDESDKILIYVHLEIAFVTLIIKKTIAEKLLKKYPEWKIDESDILITAQHTHSAPGGYSQSPLYNLTIPGFQLKVFNTIIAGILSAVEDAAKNMAQVTVSYGESVFAPETEVAFNRSMRAYLNNPECKTKSKDANLAVDRCMRGILIKNSEGLLRGFISWFGVHCTSISSFNTRIHHDNKGVAAALFEKFHPGCTAFFAQEAAGDVSPNFIWDQKLKRMRGKFLDQYESAEYNGELQFQAANKISGDFDVTGPIRTSLTYVDMNLKAAAPAHGVAFLKGTLEGPGIPKAGAAILTALAAGVRRFQLTFSSEKNRKFYQEQDPKAVILDHRDGRFLGMTFNTWKHLPGVPEPNAELFRKAAQRGEFNQLPWVPDIIPVQKIQIGELLLVTIPGEITTVAAARLKAELLKNSRGKIKKIIVASYANAYMGYVTTREEYQIQNYEGGHNVYGASTLEVLARAISELSIDI